MNERLRFVAPGVAAVLATVVLLVVDERPLNPDGASYLAIAQHWADGDWSGAINGYWSPLISILLAPAALLGVPLVVATGVLAVVTAAAAVAALGYLMSVTGVSPGIALILAIGACPFAVFAAVENVAPDLLMAVLLVVFVARVVDDRDRDPGRRAEHFVTGVIGGLAFLAKAYALPFMVVFLAVEVVVRWFARRDGETRRADVATLAIAAAVTVAVAGAWSAVISVDTGQLTYSTAADYNRRITAPGSPGNPYDWAGLIEPARSTAFWGWEDPAELPRPVSDPDATVGSIDVSESGSASARVERVVDNVKQAIRTTALAAGAGIAGGLTVVGFAMSALAGSFAREPRTRTAGSRRRRTAVLRLTLGASVYVGGLLVLVVSPRYLFFPLLLVVAVAGLGLTELDGRLPGGRRSILALAAMVALATAVRPAVALVRLEQSASDDRAVQEFLDTVDVEGRRVASSPVQLRVAGSRCLEDGCVYLGAPQLDGDLSLASQLDDFDVDLFVVDDRTDVEVPPGARMIARSDEVGYTVFDVSAVSAIEG